ncbi:MAG: glycosyltransferase family 2 protein [Clostridia bacterium]|nr:glycosyltransferase family 2 protein [Clostridia bacterium]
MISVIVPVYNAEKYLHKCVDSILNNTYSDIEVILVDDGSPDNSPAICDEYAQKDSRVKVIHKKNARASAARNDGLKLAQGEYISFVDSDDWIESDMLEKMFSTAKKYNADMVMCDTVKRGEKDTKILQPAREGFYSREQIEKELFGSLIMFENIEFPITISNCVLLIRKEIIDKNNIRYDEDIHYCEDALMGPKFLYHCQSFYYMKGNYFYNYRTNNQSTSQTFNKNKWDHYLKINSRLIESFGNDEKFDFSRQLKINLLYFVLNVISNICASDEADKKQKVKEVMTHSEVRKLFKNFKIPNTSTGLKIVVLMIKFRLSGLYCLYSKLRQSK